MTWNNDNRQLLSNLAFFGPVVAGIAAIVLSGGDPDVREWVGANLFLLLVAGGILLALLHKSTPPTTDDIAEKEARTPESPTRPRQHPREELVYYLQHVCNGPGGLERASEYLNNHLWWRPPYCTRKTCRACSACPMHQTVTSVRHGATVVRTQIVKDCRGRDPVTTPESTKCMTCKHCMPHKLDEFHDCGCPTFTANQDCPNGMDIYKPLYYPKKDDCPYWKPFFTMDRIERSWRNRRDGDLLNKIRFFELHVGTTPEKARAEAEEARRRFILISTPGTPESQESAIPEWFLEEQADFIAKSEAEAKEDARRKAAGLPPPNYGIPTI